MKKIEIKNNKKLKLKNLVIKELININVENFEIEISKFINEIKILKIHTFGPLIIRNKGLKISDDGKITSDYNLCI